MTESITSANADADPIDLPAIERELVLHASPERVWHALTNSADLSSWFPHRADIQPTVGYEGWMEWDEYGRYAIRVVESVPLERFAYRWENSPGAGLDAPGSTTVEWTLTPHPDGGTILRLRESGFVSPDSREANEEGWTAELAELVELLGRD